MIINSSYKIFNKYTPKTQVAENKPPVQTLPQIKELSAVYYQPVFTAN